jgi:hypothetical protein
MAEDASNETASDLTRIAPAPIIGFPRSGIPATRVTFYGRPPELGGPKVAVRRGKGQATKVRIYRGEWR